MKNLFFSLLILLLHANNIEAQQIISEEGIYRTKINIQRNHYKGDSALFVDVADESYKKFYFSSKEYIWLDEIEIVLFKIKFNSFFLNKKIFLVFHDQDEWKTPEGLTPFWVIKRKIQPKK